MCVCVCACVAAAGTSSCSERLSSQQWVLKMRFLRRISRIYWKRVAVPISTLVSSPLNWFRSTWNGFLRSHSIRTCSWPSANVWLRSRRNAATNTIRNHRCCRESISRTRLTCRRTSRKWAGFSCWWWGCYRNWFSKDTLLITISSRFSFSRSWNRKHPFRVKSISDIASLSIKASISEENAIRS